MVGIRFGGSRDELLTSCITTPPINKVFLDRLWPWSGELIELVAAGSSGWCDVVVANWPNWLSQDLPILIEDGAVGRGGCAGALLSSSDCPIRWRAAAQAVKIHPRVAWPSSVNGFFSTCMTGLNWYWKKICNKSKPHIVVQQFICFVAFKIELNLEWFDIWRRERAAVAGNLSDRGLSS